MSDIIFCVECPHCKDLIIIEQLNCKIFRHGAFKSNNQQINPHLSKQDCDNLILQDLIYGCGKPFMLIIVDNCYKAIECDYI